MSTIRVVNLQHTDATEPNIVLQSDGTSVFASGITISGATTLTVSGTAEFASGTATAPKITFIDDNNTGIYEPAADTVAITTAATERLRIDSSGRLLVGTTSAQTIGNSQAQLEVSTDSSTGYALSLSRSVADIYGPQINFRSTRGTAASPVIVNDNDHLGSIAFYGYDGTDSNHQHASIAAHVDGTPGANDCPGRLVLSTTADGASSPTERLRIDNSGNVGIGTTSPSAKLHVSSTAGVEALVSGGGTSGDTVLHLKGNGNAFKFIVPNSASQYGMGLYDVSNTTYRMFVDSSGNVGLGLTSPQTRLHCSGTTNGAQATFGTSSSGLKISTFQKTNNDAGVILDAQQASNGTLTFATGGSEAARIDSSGNIGVGEASPDAKLHVSYASGNPQIIIERTTSSTAKYGLHAFSNSFTIRDEAQSQERLRIDSSGNVGIGTSNPLLNLHINSATNANATIAYSENNTLKWYTRHNATTDNYEIVDIPNTSTRLAIDTSGNVGIGTASPTQRLQVTDGTHSNFYIGPGYNSDAGTLLGVGGAEYLAFATNGLANERMRIDSSGNVGIGTTSPATKLDVNGNQSSNVVAMAALDVDCSAGNYFTKTINANSTFTFSNVPASRSYSFVLELTHTSGTVTWPSSVKFPADTAPTLTTGKTHLFVFETNDGGTRFRGASLVDYVN